jgi:hypothetical protein
VNAHLDFLLSTVYGGDLHPNHRADLEQSGLEEPVRREQGFRSVPPSDFNRLLGRRVPAAVRSLLLVPFADFDGGWMDHFQVKLFPALVDEAGHTVKYWQPSGSPPRLYLVRRVLPAVLDRRVPLYLVEGPKKACAAAQFGLAAVGFSGIQGWHRRGTHQLLDDFAQIPLRGRHIRLVPDGDVQTNADVEAGAVAFASALEAAGARVDCVLLPVAA